jgi:GntR family transcriptional regulator, transcriptional repressor for pyruvate dehydrogenase complex
MGLQFEKLNVPSAYQVVSRELRRSIVSGDLKPGDQLPSEAELAEQFGVNRSTVREGIRQLENDGFVRREGRKRLCVSVPRSSDLAPRASRALVMHQVTFRELWEVARVLGPAGAALAATNRAPPQLAVLQDNIERTRNALGNATLCTQLDTEFHSAVAEGTRNAAMLHSREPVGMLLYPAFEMLHPLLPQALGRMLEAHARVAAAIVAGDATEAETWMRKHIIDFRRGWEMAGLSLDVPVNLPGGIAED